MHDRDFLAAVPDRVFKGIADDPLAGEPGHDRLGHPDRPGVVAHLDEVLHPGVEPLDVLPDQHDVHLVVPAGKNGHRRPHVGVEIEFLAERDVDRAVPLAHRGGERSLERHLPGPDAGEGRFGKRIAVEGDRRHAGGLHVPGELDAGGLEGADGLFSDLGTDPVARDQRHAVRHGLLGGRSCSVDRRSTGSVWGGRRLADILADTFRSTGATAGDAVAPRPPPEPKGRPTA